MSKSGISSNLVIILLVIGAGIIGYLWGAQPQTESVQLIPDYEAQITLLGEEINELEQSIADYLAQSEQGLLRKFEQIESISAETNEHINQLEQLLKENFEKLTLPPKAPESEETALAAAKPVKRETAQLDYIIKYKDTIWDIAQWSKGDRDILEQVQLIMQLNNITVPEKIRPGQKLLIPIN